MIVTCEQCDTQFQLDDSKVPDEGIRVRCSRCKHAFFIESPHRSDLGRASGLARDALSKGTGTVPERRSDGGLEEGESDWQFNDDGAISRRQEERSGIQAAREAVDDLLGGAASEIPTDSEAPETPVALLSRDAEFGAGEEAPPEIAAADEEPPPTAAADESEDVPDLMRDVGEHPAAGAEASLSPEPADALDVQIPELDDSNEWGSPENWDILSTPTPSPPRASETPIGRMRPVLLAESEDQPESAQRDARSGPGRSIPVETEVSPVAIWIARVRNGLGWAIVSALCGYAAYLGLWALPFGAPPALGSQSVAGLVAEGLEGHWVENAAAGPIYVVVGSLRNATSTTPPPGSQLRMRLLDADGNAIAAESAAVGPLVPAERLREWNLRDLHELQESGSRRFAWQPLKPGGRRRFSAIFARAPQFAAALELHAVPCTGQAPEPDSGTLIPYPDAELGADVGID